MASSKLGGANATSIWIDEITYDKKITGTTTLRITFPIGKANCPCCGKGKKCRSKRCCMK